MTSGSMSVQPSGSRGTLAADMVKVTREARVEIRLTEQELESWKTAADAAGLALSEWIRRRCSGERLIEPPPAPSAPKRKRR